MLRISGGSARGRTISTVGGHRLRPTASHVRAALFNHLGDAIRGARVLDLFAGSGALGLEALSRGAAEAVFVEKHPPSVRLLRAILAREGWLDRSRVVLGDVEREVARLGREGARFDLVLLDPPYDTALADRALEALRRAEIVPAGGTVVVEQRSGRDLQVPPGFRRVWNRRHGDSELLVFEGRGDAEVALP